MPLNKKDILWKGAIDDFSQDMVRMFYVNADALFDLNEAIELLDKELLEKTFFQKKKKNSFLL